MLKAREWTCILVLAAVMQPGVGPYAQEQDPERPSRQRERLGDEPLDRELELQLTVPRQEVVAPPPQPKVDEAEERRKNLESRLSAGHAALQAGRIDEPVNDCAWSHFRAALDIDPESAEALQGLELVQEAMVARAVGVAKGLDFELAERILEDATLVTDSSVRIDVARTEIAEFRSTYATELEARAVEAMDAGDFARAERVLIEMIALGGADTTVSQLRRRLQEARVYGGFMPGQIIRDQFINRSQWTPESVIILAGSYMMGSSANEEGRVDNEGPRHRVTFRRGFAIGKTEVTVGQFREFVEATRYRTDAERQGESTIYNHSSGRLTKREDVTWELNYEAHKAKDDEPVVHVSWKDANAYVKWLAKGTGKPYRLPTEAEFEYAMRAGRNTLYWWGDGAPESVVENLTGEHDVSRGRRQWATFFPDYEDKYWGPAPAASFEANPFGLYDMSGNVAEWVEDCWHDTYMRAPVDGTAWLNPGCKLRTVRGGYWASSPEQARSAFRLSAQADRRDARIGFRIARDL